MLQFAGSAQQSAATGSPWRPVNPGEALALPLRYRSGTQSVTRLWLRPMTRLSLDEKTTARLASTFTGERQVHQIQLEEGRVSVETPTLEATFLVEILVGPAVIRFGKGKLLVSVLPGGSAQIIPVSGECHVSAQDPTPWEQDGAEDRITYARGVGLKTGERLLLRELRYTRRPQESVLEKDWPFAFPEGKERPSSPTFLDPRHAWHLPPNP